MTDDDPKLGVPIVVPQLGEGVTEATAVQWVASAGDYVVAEQPILCVSLDKVDVELEAPAPGIFQPRDLPPNTVVTVGEVIGSIMPPPPVDPAVITRHDELLATIAAAPDDFDARRAYADFLLATTSTIPPWGHHTIAQRAEYLDAVLRYRRNDPKDNRVALYRRQQELRALGDRTARSLLRIAGSIETDDGFIVSVTTTLATYVTSHALVAARAPLRRLALSKIDAAGVDQLVALPRLPGLRELVLIGDRRPVPLDLVTRVATSRSFAGVTQLVLKDFVFGS
jgi:hypothetical protein